MAGCRQQPTEEQIESMDITIVDLVLASAVMVLGVWAYARKKVGAALLVGIAFGLLATAHLLALLELAGALHVLLIVIRTLGYLTAMVAVYRIRVQN
jgi:hypothetical protein